MRPNRNDTINIHNQATSTQTDAELLRRFVRDRNEAAFAQLGCRYAGLVYTACLRELHDPTQAEDAAQAVFLLLAQKAASLKPKPTLAAWLFATARLVCRNLRRQETGRRRWEAQAALADSEPHAPTENRLWDTIEPHLNEAIARLRPADREAFLLRFWDDSSLRETGERLGISEDGARMRVNRALERVRGDLRRRGVPVPTDLLSTLLAAEGGQAIHATPSTLHNAIGQIAALPHHLLSVAASGSSAPANIWHITERAVWLMKGTLRIMALKTTLRAVIILATVVVSTLGMGAWIATARSQTALHLQPAKGQEAKNFYSTLTPPPLEALLPAGSEKYTGGLVGSPTPIPKGKSDLRTAITTSALSFAQVCQFYVDHLLPEGATPQASGLEGDTDKQSCYSLQLQSGNPTATFGQQTTDYTVSVFVSRGASDSVTHITIVYGRH